MSSSTLIGKLEARVSHVFQHCANVRTSLNSLRISLAESRVILGVHTSQAPEVIKQDNSQKPDGNIIEGSQTIPSELVNRQNFQDPPQKTLVGTCWDQDLDIL
jgi:hypothetical protein